MDHTNVGALVEADRTADVSSATASYTQMRGHISNGLSRVTTTTTLDYYPGLCAY